MRTCLFLGAFHILFAYWFLSQFQWHTHRNNFNALPIGQLTQVDDQLFKDEQGRNWILQDNFNNKLHQTVHNGDKNAQLYPNIDGQIDFNSEYPNLKFLCRVNESSSNEAILMPTGLYLVDGPKRGTFNYSHPSGFFGKINHFFVDLLPHLLNSEYD